MITHMKKKINAISQPRKKKNASTTPLLLTKGYSSDNPEMNSILTMMEKLLHWAAIIDSSDDAIISKSIDGYITSWNRGAQNLYGYTPEEIVGKPVSVLMPPEKEDDFPYIMKQLQEGKKVEHYETRRKKKDGSVIDVSITVSPIRDSYGTIIGASKIARDITERVENEKRRDEFVSTTSHELKTPITSQKVFGELLEALIERNGHTEYKPYIQKINAQTNKLTKLIEDLLELSRVQMGRLKMENKIFVLDDLITEIAESTQLTTKHRIVTKGRTRKKVKGDRERIGQVLTNYLSNAIKYSPRADTVIISSQVNGKSLVVGVHDFGIGIAKENYKKVFERFYRVTGIDEKTYPGMGIGLHVCQEIISRHGGKTWVESKKGKGSTFYFSLPFVTK
jgi:PAS domain S-box-containing protein